MVILRIFVVTLVLACSGRLVAATDTSPLASLRPGHPRLLATEAQVQEMRAAAKTDPLRAAVHARILATAEAQWKEAPIEYVLVGPRLLDQSRKALGQVMTNAMAWRLSGDPRYAGFARDVMLRAAAFPDWNPSHFLDVAEMSTALALGYDWLYSFLSDAERAAIKSALLAKSLAYVEVAYGKKDPQRESFPFVRGNLENNWNQVCNGGFVLAALALAENEPALTRQVLQGLRDTLPVAMRAYEPDGAYPEGPVYWGYGTSYNVLILAALESALGDDLGLGKRPAFDRTVLFRHYVQSPTGLSFNFADGRAAMGYDASVVWLSQRYGHAAPLVRARERLQSVVNAPVQTGDRFVALHTLWFPAAPPAAVALPLDVVFRGPSQLALFRSAWDDPLALWTGLKGGSNRVNHGHLDAGSFLLDADGVRWFVDLGPDDYNLPGYWSGKEVSDPRWQYYRLNNRSHNTLTLGDALQDPDADVALVGFGSTPERAWAVAELTSAYAKTATRVIRGLALLQRKRVLVQDELSQLQSGIPLIWRALTEASVEIAPDGRAATLRRDGKALRLEILAPADARWTQRPATPPTAVENQNTGVTQLEATVPAENQPRDVRVAVLLSPVGEKWGTAPTPKLVPLSDWK